MKQVISILGGNSFLGKRLKHHLLKSGRFDLILFGGHLIQNESVQIKPYRIPEQPADLELLLQSDAIIFCAGAGVQSGKSVSSAQLYEINVFEPVRLVQTLQERGFQGKVFTFGSYFEIGNNQEMHPFTEDEVMQAQSDVPNDYCRSKRVLTKFAKNASVDFTYYHLILASIYGYGEQEKRLIPYVVQQLQRGEPLQLSNGTQIRQYIHVTDVCRLMEQLILSKPLPDRIYNVSSDDSLTVKQLVEHIQKKIPSVSPVAFGSVGRQDQSMGVLILDINKLKKDSGWEPQISITQGIDEYINANEYIV